MKQIISERGGGKTIARLMQYIDKSANSHQSGGSVYYICLKKTDVLSTRKMLQKIFEDTDISVEKKKVMLSNVITMPKMTEAEKNEEIIRMGA